MIRIVTVREISWLWLVINLFTSGVISSELKRPVREGNLSRSPLIAFIKLPSTEYKMPVLCPPCKRPDVCVNRVLRVISRLQLHHRFRFSDPRPINTKV